MYYYIQRGTRNCGVLFPTIFTFLWAISRPCFAELLNDNLSLVETTYDPAIYALEGNSAITNYTLPSFLANVVTKSGTFAINTTDEDQNLPHYQTGFSWDSDEGRTFPTWKPLAIATWQDSIMGVVTEETISAVDDVVKGTVVVSWKDTAKDNNGGLRVTFIANGTGSNIQRRYKHVLLVENPTVKPGEGLEFSLINSTSIGGLVWYGNWLYVGDGKKGLRVFDMEHIWKIDSKVGRGMEYAIPQVRYVFKHSCYPPPQTSSCNSSFFTLFIFIASSIFFSYEDTPLYIMLKLTITNIAHTLLQTFLPRGKLSPSTYSPSTVTLPLRAFWLVNMKKTTLP